MSSSSRNNGSIKIVDSFYSTNVNDDAFIHGPTGTLVRQIAHVEGKPYKQQDRVAVGSISQEFLQNLSDDEIILVLKSVIKQFVEDFQKEDCPIFEEAFHSGSTLNLNVIHNNKIFNCSVGDSPTYLMQITKDGKITFIPLFEELHDINDKNIAKLMQEKNSDGTPRYRFTKDKQGGDRLKHPDYEFDRNLALYGSMGDKEWVESGLTSEPSIKKTVLDFTSDRQYILLSSSDGLFEQVANKKKSQVKPEEFAKNLSKFTTLYSLSNSLKEVAKQNMSQDNTSYSLTSLSSNQNSSFTLVCDGHGPSDQVSEFITKNFGNYLTQKLQQQLENKKQQFNAQQKSQIAQAIQSNIQFISKYAKNNAELIIAILRHDIGESPEISEDIELSFTVAIDNKTSHIHTILEKPNLILPELKKEYYEDARNYGYELVKGVIASYLKAMMKQIKQAESDYEELEANAKLLISNIKLDEISLHSASSSSSTNTVWWEKYIPVNSRKNIKSSDEQQKIIDNLSRLLPVLREALVDLNANSYLKKIKLIHDILNLALEAVKFPSEENLSHLTESVRPLGMKKTSQSELLIFENITFLWCSLQKALALSQDKLIFKSMEQNLIDEYKKRLFSKPSNELITSYQEYLQKNIALANSGTSASVISASTVLPSPTSADYKIKELDNKILALILSEPVMDHRILNSLVERNNHVIKMLDLVSTLKEKHSTLLIIEFLKILANTIEKPDMINVRELNRINRDLTGNALQDPILSELTNLTRQVIEISQQICGLDAEGTQLLIGANLKEDDWLQQYHQDFLNVESLAQQLETKMKLVPNF